MSRPAVPGGLLQRLLACVALVLLSPLLALIAAGVLLSSPGPLFYRQVRVGHRGREFRIIKFRTMCVGADRMAANISPTGDPRITRFGRFLRGSYLDELPQLLNVVRGEMRLVGPRPETPEFVALYDRDERRVLAIPPGLVGASTLGFMDEGRRLAAAVDPERYYRDTLLHERVRLDLHYLENRTATSDLRLLVLQSVAILRAGFAKVVTGR